MTEAVIFIGGSGRSGSTLLDRILGQLPGVESAGEIRDIWRAGLRENRLCGCGQPFHECPFWTRVGEAAFGGWAAVDAGEAERLIGSFGYVDVLRRRADRGADAHRLDLLRRLYGGIATASGGRTLIDSSKAPPYGVLLADALPGRVRAIHLVRDPRGVAYSWGKVVQRPDTPGRDVEMLRLSPARVAARWVAHNVVMESLSRRVPWARVRYEQLLSRPRQEIRRLADAIGHPATEVDLSFLTDDTVTLHADHTVMGNPMRMSVGTIPLQLDDVWRARMPVADRALVTAATLPFLLRYGYAVR